MIESWSFVLALVAVLMIPGPTNALWASAAHHHGLLKTLSLLPVQLLGYLYSIGLWALLIHLSQPVWPLLLPILHLASLLYVLWLVLRLWKTDHLHKYSQQYKQIRPDQMFISSMKNPKALLFAAGILPPETWDSLSTFMQVMGVFSLVLLPSALLWMLLGQALLAPERGKIKVGHLYKGSAMLLLLCMTPLFFRFF